MYLFSILYYDSVIMHVRTNDSLQQTKSTYGYKKQPEPEPIIYMGLFTIIS